jgi:hypothetical protein
LLRQDVIADGQSLLRRKLAPEVSALLRAHRVPETLPLRRRHAAQRLVWGRLGARHVGDGKKHTGGNETKKANGIGKHDEMLGRPLTGSASAG